MSLYYILPENIYGSAIIKSSFWFFLIKKSPMVLVTESLLGSTLNGPYVFYFVFSSITTFL